MKYLFWISLFVITSCKKDPKPVPNIYWGSGVSDADGNQYKTVVIKDQEWMAENLRTTKFCDGTAIPEATTDSNLTEASSPIWAYYQFDADNNNPHGKLYNGFVAQSSSNPCPCGWRVPVVADWEILINFLGGNEIAGDKLKFVSQQFNWGSEQTELHNISLFSAYPSGSFNMNPFVNINAFGGMMNQTAFYTITNNNQTELFYFSLARNQSKISKYFTHLKNTLSIRCIKN